MSVEGSEATQDLVQLFQFLRDVQLLRTKVSKTLSEYTGGGGAVIDLDAVGELNGVSCPGLAAASAGAPLVIIPRLAPATSPQLDADLLPWIDWDIRDIKSATKILDAIPVPANSTLEESDEEPSFIELADQPEDFDRVVLFEAAWAKWAEQEREAIPTREAYQKLYGIKELFDGSSQDWELVLGVGRLKWKDVDRHVLVQPIRIEMDPLSAALKVYSDDLFRVEEDMLSPEQKPSPRVSDELAVDLDQVFDREELAQKLKAYVFNLDASGTYEDRSNDSQAPWMRLSPTIVLRQRSRLGLVDALNGIAEYMQSSDEVPEGLIPLVNPDAVKNDDQHRPPRDDGAVQWDEGDAFLPLPVNQQQLEVIRRVDHRQLTLVQGPPGTGKTHTTAALISHLLAQGKRVLVTAQSDQALHEVRGKLPESIQDLAVTVTGTSQAERALLTKSVGTLAEQAHNHNPRETESQINNLLTEIDSAMRRRASFRKLLLQMKEVDVAVNTVGPYSGTFATIAQALIKDQEKYEWILEELGSDVIDQSPLQSGEWKELLILLQDQELIQRAPEALQVLPAAGAMTAPSVVSAWFENLIQVEKVLEEREVFASQRSVVRLRELEVAARVEIKQKLDQLLITSNRWHARTESWIPDCLKDILEDKASLWESRKSQVSKYLSLAQEQLDAMGNENSILIRQGTPTEYQVMAQAVLTYLQEGNSIKTDILGKPKFGLLTSKTVKACELFFTNVWVEGKPATTIDAVRRYLARIKLEEALEGLDASWPSTTIPPEDTFVERLAWHAAELSILQGLIEFGTQFAQFKNLLAESGFDEGVVGEVEDLNQLSGAIEFVDAERGLQECQLPLVTAVREFESLDSATAPSPMARNLAAALKTRDFDEYVRLFDRSHYLYSVRSRISRKDELMSAVARTAPKLAQSLARDFSDSRWNDRVEVIEKAWQWYLAEQWVERQRPENINALQANLQREDQIIRGLVGQLATKRAWSKSVSRLKQSQISDLVQYTQLVKKLGKGTGKYAARQQADIRSVLSRCTDSVPVWIVPLHRVATQFKITPELFDVVIVDEASQAGLEATFLQFLGKKMVVVGDDKQVSPTVIIDRSQIHSLAARYLNGSPYHATWSDPERSLFDEARAKFSDLITLVEHRRCVPDIIGFSNEIAYEPDGVRLIPVREPGSSALPPIKTHYVEDGYAEGTPSSRRNPVEAERIVDAIEAAINDPKYDDMTMGVISLLGEAQAKLIEKMLLERIDPLEISRRKLRCGVAATFQGAERNVIFLSMVSASDENTRFAAQTKETAVQRYNVAVSRAQDQLQVFHSEPLSSLANSADLRRQLLEYCMRIETRAGLGIPGATQGLVDENVLVEPFDSKFEQRVHNRIFERGYVLIPQYASLGYSIDLVVVGSRGKIAVECDGDHWHGPDQYAADLARQRELERCGWKFFRVRESDFIIDPHKALENLWPLLEVLESNDQPQSTQETVVVEEQISNDELLVEVPAYEQEETTHSLITNSDNQNKLLGLTGNEISAQEVSELAHESEGTSVADVISSSFPRTDRRNAAIGVSSVAAVELWQSEYTSWANVGIDSDTPTKKAPNLYTLSRSELQTLANAIVQVEGPVVGQRIINLCIKASFTVTLGERAEQRICDALQELVDRGDLLVDDVLDARNIQEQTFRLPEQLPVLLRARGDRAWYEIPPREIYEAMLNLRVLTDVTDDELFQDLRRIYGLPELSESTNEYFRAIREL